MESRVSALLQHPALLAATAGVAGVVFPRLPGWLYMVLWQVNGDSEALQVLAGSGFAWSGVLGGITLALLNTRACWWMLLVYMAPELVSLLDVIVDPRRKVALGMTAVGLGMTAGAVVGGILVGLVLRHVARAVRHR